ncbi:MAG: hypothetical protein OCD02_17425 [Spirochaetaceae bacterium]
MKGIKIYNVPVDIKEDVSRMLQLNIDTAFLGNEASLNKKLIDSIKEVGIDVFLICPVFYNPEYLRDNEDSWSITQHDKKASESWVQFVCPTNKKYLTYLKNKIIDLAKLMNPYGITLDFIRFFTFWEMIEPSTHSVNISHGCFCDNCIKQFSKHNFIPENLTKIERNKWIIREVPEMWIQWKQRVILSVAKELIKSIHSVSSDLKTAIHIVPWITNEFNDGLKSIVGQNTDKLSKITNYLTPMAYAPMCKRESIWINELVCDLQSHSKVPIIPSIQVSKAYDEEEVTPKRFKLDLESATKYPSKGVLLWSWESLLKSPDKYKIFKEFKKK